MRTLNRLTILLGLLMTLCGAASAKKPNMVVILADDMGYGDLGCYGSLKTKTPFLDQMAEEGVKLTSFYVAAPLCTPSRAALMTGSYPSRVNLAVGCGGHGTLFPGDPKGLNPNEITMAETLKSVGYKTGMFGKWHLGDQPEFLPTRQGFDEFFGIPYSHDMNPYNKKAKFPPLPLMEGEKVIELDPDADYLTRRFTERAVRFIKENKDHSFFLYVPHVMPHRPIHMSPPFMDKIPEEIKAKLANEEGDDYPTRDKIYDYAISEIDWSVGKILDALKKYGLDENTIVIFTSDNGPAAKAKGSAKPLRGGKGSVFEGGMREPAIIRWPGKIPAGQVVDELVTAMDLYPTFAKLAGSKMPDDRVIDGLDIWPVLVHNAKTPHKAFFYVKKGELQAVRSGKWKLHIRGDQVVALYDLKNDISESNNVLKGNPEVADQLLGYMKDFRDDIKNNNRPAGSVENPKPLTR